MLVVDLRGDCCIQAVPTAVGPNRGPSVSDLIWLKKKKNLYYLLMLQIIIKNLLTTIASLNQTFFLIPYPILYGNLKFYLAMYKYSYRSADMM